MTQTRTIVRRVKTAIRERGCQSNGGIAYSQLEPDHANLSLGYQSPPLILAGLNGKHAACHHQRWRQQNFLTGAQVGLDPEMTVDTEQMLNPRLL
jgi:hypothetical protein